jgi:Raf kinase inhibitor-like YbhB/YbcL family protein
MSFYLRSAAFGPGRPIPRKYTGDGLNCSPPLEWGNVPPGVGSFALVVEDPDAPAGLWCHWLLYDLPPNCLRLLDGESPSGGQRGRNSWGRSDYGGPAPPRGRHRYVFRLYALDTCLGLPAGLDRAGLLPALTGHVLAQAELMGVYSRE